MIATGLTCSVLVLHSLPSFASEVDDTCGADINPSSGTPTQRQQQCQTAKSAEKGAGADKVTAGVWAGVAGVCTYACASAGTNEYVCSGSQMAGGVSEGVATKNFQSAMTGIMAAGTSLAASKAAQSAATKSATEAGKEGSKNSERDIAACASAATAAAQSYAKVKSMNNAKGTQQASLNAANSLNSNALGANGSGSSADAQSQGATAGGISSSTPTDAESRRNAACAGVDGNSSHASIIQCAIANDPSLPAFVTTPRFAGELQKNVGMTLPQIVSRADNPSPLLTQSMGGVFGGDSGSVAKLAGALKTLESGMAADQVGGSAYASSGGGSGSSGLGSGADPSADAMKMMADMMAQMNPDQPKDDPYKSGVGAVIFANQHRAPAAVAEDRGLNIFDRVTYRYYYVGRRIVLGEGSK